MGGKTSNDTAFGMTRQEVSAVVRHIAEKEVSSNTDGGDYKEHAAAIRRGREALEKQEGYYKNPPGGV